MKTKCEKASRTGTIFFLLSMFLGTGVCLTGCGGRGDTANSGDPNAGLGQPYVSSQGGGSTIRLELEGTGNEIRVADTRNFKVTLTDPQGAPISHVRVFCESEKGISILEPSSGGVAFAHTNVNGVMSGVLGGLLPGSHMLECRAPQGFDLTARMHIRLTGEVPEGFAGFPGAAGGNLGGGTIVYPPVGQDLAVAEALFSTVTNTTPQRVGDLDIIFSMCKTGEDADGNDILEAEPFGPDNFHVTVANGLTERVFVRSITIEAPNGSGGTVVFERQLTSLLIEAGGNNTFAGAFTQTNPSSPLKQYAGTNVAVPEGTHNVRFNLNAETASGRTERVEFFGIIRAYGINNCRSGTPQ